MSFFSKINFKINYCRLFCTNYLKRNISPKKKICIVGAGPAGFYATQYILKHLPDCEVHLLEKLPVPFGLVRFGVAPDHPDVKNVVNTFSKTAENKNFKFYGNFELGRNYTLKNLRDSYHVVILTYGADLDRKLEVPNENTSNVLSAREFVAWYNGLPGAENLNPNLENETTVSIIGQGNVAIDVARILLSPIDILKQTDITQIALEKLSNSKVKKVNLIGRRGPLQAAFTIKELREMLKLPYVNTIWRKSDFLDIAEHIPNLQRPRKRLTELMLNSLDQFRKTKEDEKVFMPIFLRSPFEFTKCGVNCIINEMKDKKAIATHRKEFFQSGILLRSIGYKSTCYDNDISFSEIDGYVLNRFGRVLLNSEENIYDKGLYVAGWLATGPTGVILTTMNTAFAVAKTVCDDINREFIDTASEKPGVDTCNQNTVTWSSWQKIDDYEKKEGKKLGKPREKIISIKKMLEIAGV